MVPPETRVNLRGVRPNSARVTTRVFSSKATLFEVFEQGRHDVVELRDEFLVGLEILAVAIPTRPGRPGRTARRPQSGSERPGPAHQTGSGRRRLEPFAALW